MWFGIIFSKATADLPKIPMDVALKCKTKLKIYCALKLIFTFAFLKRTYSNTQNSNILTCFGQKRVERGVREREKDSL